MKNKVLLIILFGMIFVSCKQENIMQKTMVNNWQTTYFKLEMPTAYGKDSLQIMENDFTKPNSTLAQSSYKEDGTFKAWYLTPEGKKVGETDGKWNVVGDSLFTEYTLNNKTVKPSYFVKKTPEGILFKSLYDWDGDGKKDDTITMKSKIITLD